MSDDKSQRGTPDRSRINVHEDYELRYWAEKFAVSKEALKEAVKTAGPMVDNVRRQLGK